MARSGRVTVDSTGVSGTEYHLGGTKGKVSTVIASMMKGLILAGGSSTRLYSATLAEQDRLAATTTQFANPTQYAVMKPSAVSPKNSTQSWSTVSQCCVRKDSVGSAHNRRTHEL